MPEKVRIYGEISPRHELEFLFLKGALGRKNNGDALERIIDIAAPIVKEQLNKKA